MMMVVVVVGGREAKGFESSWGKFQEVKILYE
jgi:hypothetical protein